MQGPLLSAVESQDNTWCLVGPEGRHKHWQSAQGSAAASVNNKVDFSLASLPGPAIASILHHLDIYSSHQLARTCRTCAREAAHYRTHYKRDYCAKILPSVQSVAGIRGDHYGDRYGELKCAWTGSSCDALPYIHTMSQQPDFLASMWKAAWSAVPHSFFTDIRSMWGEAMSGDFGYGNKGSCLTIQLFALHRCTYPWRGCKPFVELQKPQSYRNFSMREQAMSIMSWTLLAGCTDHKVSFKRMNVMEWSHHRVGHGNM